MKNTITVFTATYNRANLLPRLYESLTAQTNQNFNWLVVDDGSVDNSENLIKGYQKEGVIKIQYIYQDNGGLHTGYNTAIQNITTELAVCVDSDDFMPDNAIEIIIQFWEKYGSNQYAGIIGLDYNMDGLPLAGPLPNVKSLYFIDLKNKYKYRGDTKLVHRTELLKKFAPMPTFNNEKNFNPSYIFLQIDTLHPLLVLNENLCFVEYQQEGMSNNIYKQYRNSPNSFLAMRNLYLSLDRTDLVFKIKNIIHLISSAIFSKKFTTILSPPFLLLKVLLIPFGLLLNFYVRIKTR